MKTVIEGVWMYVCGQNACVYCVLSLLNGDTIDPNGGPMLIYIMIGLYTHDAQKYPQT